MIAESYDIPLDVVFERASPAFRKKIQYSIDLLRKAKDLALRYSSDGFYLAFSGGKDSQALYHVAKLAGVPFKCHMNLTSVDPPQVIMFVKKHYPSVELHKPVDSIYNIAYKRKYLLPSRLIRWCCADLKEKGGAGTVTLTGILYYQGEQDAEVTDQYDVLMKLLIRSWRELFREEDLPFLFVQLPMWLNWHIT